MPKDLISIPSISAATLRRLPLYLSYLHTLSQNRQETVSSAAIANKLGLGEIQVRKDLSAVSGQGKPKVGYYVTALCADLEQFLGYHDINNAVVVGTGKLGTALLDYSGFEEYGLKLVAGFDCDPDKCGRTAADKPIFNIAQFEKLVPRMMIRIGIIAVPAEHAQNVCDLMVRNGILAIMNFAPVHLQTSRKVLIQNENIAASLAILSSHLKAVMNEQTDNQIQVQNGGI